MKFTRRDFGRSIAAAGLGASLGCGANQVGDPNGKKVIVLGLDGLDPKIIQFLIEQGRAPNFKKLSEMGAFHPLGTSMPALSPVAWSSFITGMTPGGHGIPDFIARDPLTYMPFFAIWEPRAADRSITVGDYEIPISGGGPENLRHGRTFWSYLTEAGIPATIIKVPTNFPVEETATRAISGMGTPDLVDSFGQFCYFTSDPDERYDNISGGIVTPVRVISGRVDAEISGPPHPLNRALTKNMTVPFQVYVDPTEPVVRIDIQGKSIVLLEGEFSDWVQLDFEVLPLLESLVGNARFYAKQVHPHLQLYVTPINVDPSEQAAPVTYPPELGGEIASHIGPFWTKGLPSDTKPFDAGIFTDEDYVKQAQLILEDRLQLFDYEWSQFKSGLFYFYVSSTDQDTHMLWRNMDETHPMHQASDVRYSGYIYHMYERMDEVVGKMLPAADDDTLFIVCSDHGFAQFGRQFHLNTWLRDNGYLVLKDEAKKKERTNPLDINWDETVAYGVGFNGLYLNQVGREERGIVGPDKAPELIARISKELEAITHAETGKRPVYKVYKRDDLYSGEMTPEMPEMLVGYTPGFRCANDSILLETGKEIIDVNKLAWAGDHSMALDLVPGSLFISRPIKKANPNIVDLPVTILDWFGLEKPQQMVGGSLFRV